MSRSIVLSNGELCVALDARAEVRDLYYPHVGLEDHVRGHYLHRVGVWVDGRMSWFDEDGGWDISVSCEEEALVSTIVARHNGLGVEVSFKDTVYNEKPVFVREVNVTNRSDRTRDIKLYFSQQFEIYKAHGGDTAYFEPRFHAIVHYKGQRAFLISAMLEGALFNDYAVGLAGFAGKEGSHRDADDGVLSKNPIEHGQVDSILGLYAGYEPGQSRTGHYWIAAGKSIDECLVLNDMVRRKRPEHLVRTTSDYWKAWLRAYEWNFKDLTPEHVALFKRSLMYVRAHVDNCGGILASVDSDMLRQGMDTYAYVWFRDAAFAALALDRAGDTNVAKRFFEFCSRAITNDGYFMHKYLPDGSLGSSWHPWIANGDIQLPIQEDETALVLFALREHYRRSHDLEFLESMYASLVERTADFLCTYRNESTKLPEPSYDLWEEKRGTSTFTASAVYGALSAAAELSKILGKDRNAARYELASHEVQTGIISHLWDDKLGAFVKHLNIAVDGSFIYDRTIDASSAYGVFAFNVLPVEDARLVRAWGTTARELSYGIRFGGLARHQGDAYYHEDNAAVGNPWNITTLWYAEYLIAQARTSADLDRVRELLSWVARHAQPSGVLSEQLDPNTGNQLSAAPLTWSHAGYLLAVFKYLDHIG